MNNVEVHPLTLVTFPEFARENMHLTKSTLCDVAMDADASPS